MTRALAFVPLLAVLTAAPAFAADAPKATTQPPAAQTQVPGCPGWNAAGPGRRGPGMMQGKGPGPGAHMTAEQRQAMLDAHKGMMGGKGGAAMGPQNCPGMAQAPAAKPEPKPDAKPEAK